MSATTKLILPPAHRPLTTGESRLEVAAPHNLPWTLDANGGSYGYIRDRYGTIVFVIQQLHIPENREDGEFVVGFPDKLRECKALEFQVEQYQSFVAEAIDYIGDNYPAKDDQARHLYEWGQRMLEEFRAVTIS